MRYWWKTKYTFFKELVSSREESTRVEVQTKDGKRNLYRSKFIYLLLKREDRDVVGNVSIT